MDQLFTRVATRISSLVGQPLAFVIATLSIIVWAVTGPVFDYSETWQLVVNTSTTIITFLMIFLVQNSQNRDAAAMQAKLDELIRVTASARDEFIGIEHLADSEIERIRTDLEREARDPNTRSSADSIGRLLGRT